MATGTFHADCTASEARRPEAGSRAGGVSRPEGGNDGSPTGAKPRRGFDAKHDSATGHLPGGRGRPQDFNEIPVDCNCSWHRHNDTCHGHTRVARRRPARPRPRMATARTARRERCTRLRTRTGMRSAPALSQGRCPSHTAADTPAWCYCRDDPTAPKALVNARRAFTESKRSAQRPARGA